jgi:hypothetical protein
MTIVKYIGAAAPRPLPVVDRRRESVEAVSGIIRVVSVMRHRIAMAKVAFIPNDPLAGTSAPPLRKKAKRKNRPAARASFTLPTAPAEDVFEPGTPEFLFWQCREASLAALASWETYAGPHTRWQGNRKKIQLVPDAGNDLNAFYDRDSVTFFHQAIGSKTYLSGNSTDAVAHEVGHGLLDTIRPDLWAATFVETAAFHEAFGDCIALLTAFSDATTRRKLLANGTLRKKNFVESTAEELSEGIKRIAPNHNAAAPRRATRGSLDASTKKDLVKRMGAGGSERISTASADLFGQPVTRAVLHKEIELGGIHRGLKGVVAQVDVPVNVGSSGARAAIVGAMPEPVAIEEEVQTFVRSLLKQGQIELSQKAARATRHAANTNGRKTHTIATVKGTKVLKRVCFHCS